MENFLFRMLKVFLGWSSFFFLGWLTTYINLEFYNIIIFFYIFSFFFFNLRSLIQPSETLLVELNRTHSHFFFFFKFLGKLHIWFLSYTLYFNMIPNLLIVSIWSITFQYCDNLVHVIVFWKKIDGMSNGQNKKLASIDVTINLNFILIVCHVSNFYLRYNSRD